jgi:hypothetical protein
MEIWKSLTRALRGVTWASLCFLLCLPLACRSDKPPEISLVCILDGYGGLDCSTPDHHHVYVPPSSAKGYWCAPEADVANYMSWCYKAPVAAVEEEMQKIDAVARQ